ncbi:MAG: hypothetical protein KME59_21485 [Trichormus sp. ATA11-4-KO1]|jgi:hypothetical protein|nr:hypothetical protein [Trichormus sp. ATA11-4-KO1]
MLGYGSEVSQSQIEAELEAELELEVPEGFRNELENNPFWNALWEYSPDIDQDEDSIVIW